MTSEAATQDGRERERVWQDAWQRALPLVDGAARGRLPGATPDVELAYLDWGGEGPLVVLLHANGFCAATWAPIASALRRRFRIVAIDVRGHGDSTPVDAGADPAAYAWTTLAADVDHALAALLERTGIGRIALGVGHSMGGALVAANAVLRPERFERLLLCDPVLLPPAPSASADAGRSEAKRLGNPLAESARKRRDRFPSAAEAYAHCRSRALYADFTPEALALYVGLGMHELESGERVLKCAPQVEGAIFASAGLFDLMEPFARLAPELVILHAGRGNFSRPYYEALARRAPNARVEGVDGQHLFPMEDPRIVIEWIERLLPAAAQPA
ncbi:MAG: alpha/beta hydrolase [Myxococcota bacterium]